MTWDEVVAIGRLLSATLDLVAGMWLLCRVWRVFLLDEDERRMTQRWMLITLVLIVLAI